MVEHGKGLLKVRSKAQIKQEIKDTNEKLLNLQWSVKKDPIVIKTKKAYDDALENAQNKIAKEVLELRNQHNKLLEEIDDIEKAKEIVIPQKVQDFISAICRGVDFGYKGWVVKWVSPKQRFAIMTNPGHSGWSGRGETSYYGSDHYLFDITKINDKNPSGFDLSYVHCTVFKKYNGRLDKETKQKWIDYATEQESK